MLAITVFCQNLKNIKIFAILILLAFLFFVFHKFHMVAKYDDLLCREMLHNGTSQGGTLDSWHTTGCTIHTYTLK